MSESDDVYWKVRLDELRKGEMHEVNNASAHFRKDDRLSIDEIGSIAGEFNEVFRRAGYPWTAKGEPQNALTYSLYREGIHRMRMKFAELHPELVDEFNTLAPVRKSRSV